MSTIAVVSTVAVVVHCRFGCTGTVVSTAAVVVYCRSVAVVYCLGHRSEASNRDSCVPGTEPYGRH